MIVLCITKRPHLAPFLWAQLQKMKGVSITPVIYQNGEYTDFWVNKGILNHHRPEWKNQSDCFNAFQQDYADLDEHVLVWDDDVFLDHDFTSKYEQALNNGYDHVCHTVTWFYHWQPKQTYVRVRKTWLAKRVGIFGIHKDLWKEIPWPDRPADAMLAWFKDLGEHNIRALPYLDYTHLIHGDNTILKPDVFNRPNAQGQESLGAKHPLVLAVDALNGL